MVSNHNRKNTRRENMSPQGTSLNPSNVKGKTVKFESVFLTKTTQIIFLTRSRTHEIWSKYHRLSQKSKFLREETIHDLKNYKSQSLLTHKKNEK